jgi:gluconolactonase
LALPDFMVTNVCFGGDRLRTAYVTCSATGTILSFAWPRAGLKLAY